MVIRIIGGEQVVCDCQGGTPDKYLAKLLVGITASKDRVMVTIFCLAFDYSQKYEITSRLTIESGPDRQTPTE
jgi:hypothetical protein